MAKIVLGAATPSRNNAAITGIDQPQFSPWCGTRYGGLRLAWVYARDNQAVITTPFILSGDVALHRGRHHDARRWPRRSAASPRRSWCAGARR